MGKGTKRTSPGADGEKNPLSDVELSDEDAKRLDTVQRDIARAELALERQAQLKLVSVYQKRREVVRTLNKFWAVALMNHPLISFNVQHNADQSALSYLEDLWVERDKQEPRCFTIEFHFKENPFFTDKVLKKEFKYVPHEAADEQADEDGITPSMLDFSWERDVEPSAIKINWKDAEKALTKLYPREVGEDEDDMPAEPGSFFNFFEQVKDMTEIGPTISNEIFPDAIDYFLGKAGGDELDSEDEEDEEDDEDEDEDEEEIDLEKPRSKKQRI